MRCFDQFAGNESCHESMPSSIGRVVVNEKVVRVSSSLRQTLHGFFIRLWNRTERYSLSASAHPDDYAACVELRVFGGNEQHLCCVTCFAGALQQFRVNNEILDLERSAVPDYGLALVWYWGN